MTGHGCGECHETVPPAVRAEMLEACGYRCQGCGRCSPEAGGWATLHVHHHSRDRDGVAEHDPANLTVLCRFCHHWHHLRPTPDDPPVQVTTADLRELVPRDLEILQVLAADGPATTGEIAGALTAEPTRMTVRERLWVLMGLDNRVADRERQLVDQDVESGRWGLTGQIAHSARGEIPDEPQTLLQRVEDEHVRRALERGCARETIAGVLDVTRRTTFHMEKRAYAYDFPLEAIDRRGGRPSTEYDERHAAASEPGAVDRDGEHHADP